MTIVLGLEGWHGEIAATFTIRNARLIAQAMSDQLLEKEGLGSGVVIGYDTRFLSDKFARECARVFAANSIPVYLLDGVTPTPLVSFAVRYFGAARGLMVTAGHRAHDTNGLKWKGEQGWPLSAEEVQAIAAKVGKSAVETMPFDLAVKEGWIRLCNCDAPYLSQVMRFLSTNLSQHRQLHVVVDTMHGAAGRHFAQVLQEIGCRVTTLRDTPDPLFGGVDPEPVEANLTLLQEKVVAVGADLGIATDGDGDRLAAVDAAGRWVAPHILFSLLTEHVMRVREWTGDVVKTFSTIRQLMQKADVVIGGDDSGGFVIPRHLPDRDALFAALLLIEHLVLTEQTLAEAASRI